MRLFQVLFTLGMLLFPLVFMLFVRPRRDDLDRALIRRRRVRLWLATGTALVVFGVLVLWLRREWADRGLWALFFPLWFAFAMPLFQALRPESARAHPPGPSRAARLAPRHVVVPLAWHVPAWTFLGLGVSAVAARWATHGLPRSAASWILPLCLLAGALFPVVTTPLLLRHLGDEAEPMDEAGSPEIAAAYDSLRRSRVKAFVTLEIAMTALFAGLAAAVAWIPSPAFLGVAGGVGGTIVGIGGAVFGVRAGAQRMRILRMLEERTTVRPGA
jgi:O-antigen/teichoic acid export membrane protein